MWLMPCHYHVHIRVPKTHHIHQTMESAIVLHKIPSAYIKWIWKIPPSTNILFFKYFEILLLFKFIVWFHLQTKNKTKKKIKLLYLINKKWAAVPGIHWIFHCNMNVNMSFRVWFSVISIRYYLIFVLKIHSYLFG